MPSWLLLPLVCFLAPAVHATASMECTDYLYWLGAQRQCCKTTGLCQDSSCTVFGYPNSARANCHTSGSNVDCPRSICQYLVPTCEPQGTQHCYGTVVCANGTKACTGYGRLCLEDGNSQNFKICGADSLSTDSPAERIPIGTGACAACEMDVPSNYQFVASAVDFPASCSIEQAQRILQDYTCTRPEGICNHLQCGKTIPAGALAQLRSGC